MVSLLNSQGMKSCKSRESFCLSILTIYTNDWSTFWHVYWCHVYFFFCEIPKYMQTKNRLAHFDWDFMEVGWQVCWAYWGWWMQADTIPSDLKFSCKWNLSFFKAVPSNRLSFLLGSPLHIISSLFSHFCLFQNAVLQKILKLGFLSLVLVISLSWYLHLTVSHEFLTFISFDIWR